MAHRMAHPELFDLAPGPRTPRTEAGRHGHVVRPAALDAGRSGG
jgi:hypothetical protein